jgi:predicted molibdopterin-dependent oxidoreductase YjgC
MTKPSKVLVICASPRHNGNSAILAAAAAEGAKEAGHDVETVFLDDYVEGMLRDCRTCRNVEGNCSIDDMYGELFLKKFLPAHDSKLSLIAFFVLHPIQLLMVRSTRNRCKTSKSAS